MKIFDFKKMKQKNEPIVMLTCYDYYSAKICEENKIDMLLIGDSLGMAVYGYEDTLSVNIEDVVRHTQAVRRGAPNAFIVSDMPYMSYHISEEESKKNAANLIINGKADCVKIEGGSDNRLKMIKAIIDCEIPVIGHLGLTPQSIHKFGGFKVQGKEKTQQETIISNALKLQDAGVFLLVLEGIPEELGKEITERLEIPTIGIGAGRFTDGQVLVWHDVLGLSTVETKFSQKWLNCGQQISQAVNQYKNDVKDKEFPKKENVYYPID